MESRQARRVPSGSLSLDAIALRVRQAKRVVSTPVLVAVAVLTDGQKRLVALEMCGSESRDAWKGFLDEMAACGLAMPRLCVVDGCPGSAARSN